MKINGFQKMTLLDFPGRVACTVFTGGCNLRCPFCHNALLVTEVADLEEIPEEEVLKVLSKRKGILDGVAITGGEPLLQKDIADFIRKVRGMGFQVKLDTNGTYPDRLKALVAEGLIDYVAVDVKNSPEKYAETTGASGIDMQAIRETVDFLLAGSVDYEFRTTIVREFHEPEDIERIGEWIRGAKHWYLQNFVDSGNLIGEELHAHERETLLQMAETARRYVENAAVRGID